VNSSAISTITYVTSKAFNDADSRLYPQTAKTASVAARNAIPPPKARQKIFHSRPRAQISQDTLTDEEAQAAAAPTSIPSLSDGDVQIRVAASAATAARTAPSAAARAPVLNASEGADEAVESKADSDERPGENPPRRGTKTGVAQPSRADSDEREGRELPPHARRESPGPTAFGFGFLGIDGHTATAHSRMFPVACQFKDKSAILQTVEDARRAAPRILIADDIPDLLQVLKDALEKAGYAVTAVGDGAAALESIRLDPPDIAVLDLKMPKLTGFDVCRALRDDPLLENLPVVILSAAATRENKIDGLDLGADDFITKPVDIRELLARIRMIIKRTRQGLDANPLTRLPGNLAIESRIERALSEKRPLAVLYVDLNQFKAYNDAYGYDSGDRVLQALARVLVDQVRAGGPTDFIGHIGGDDFIALSTPERMEEAARAICASFDAKVPTFYNEADRARGMIVAKDRQGATREFPLLSVAIGICHNQDKPLTSFAQIAALGAELKKAAKSRAGSSYVLDRRREDASR